MMGVEDEGNTQESSLDEATRAVEEELYKMAVQSALRHFNSMGLSAIMAITTQSGVTVLGMLGPKPILAWMVDELQRNREELGEAAPKRGDANPGTDFTRSVKFH